MKLKNSNKLSFYWDFIALNGVDQRKVFESKVCIVILWKWSSLMILALNPNSFDVLLEEDIWGIWKNDAHYFFPIMITDDDKFLEGFFATSQKLKKGIFNQPPEFVKSIQFYEGEKTSSKEKLKELLKSIFVKKFD